MSPGGSSGYEGVCGCNENLLVPPITYECKKIKQIQL